MIQYHTKQFFRRVSGFTVVSKNNCPSLLVFLKVVPWKSGNESQKTRKRCMSWIESVIAITILAIIIVKTEFVARSSNKMKQNSKRCHLSLLSLAIFPTPLLEFCWQMLCAHFVLNSLSKFGSQFWLTISILDTSLFFPDYQKIT